MKGQTKQLVHRLSQEKERLIANALDHVLGKEWAIKDLHGRGEFKILPDKTEIFCFDGVDLIHFMVPETHIDNSLAGMSINGTYKYKLLYSLKEKET